MKLLVGRSRRGVAPSIAQRVDAASVLLSDVPIPRFFQGDLGDPSCGAVEEMEPAHASGRQRRTEESVAIAPNRTTLNLHIAQPFQLTFI